MDSAPFVGSEALANGLVTRQQLRGHFRRIYRDVYIDPDSELDAPTRARAAWLYSHGNAVVSGLSAAALHGSKWISGDDDAELLWAEHRKKFDGLRIGFDELAPNETETVDGVVITTAARTAYDLGRRRPFGTAVARLDALCRATGVGTHEIGRLAEDHRGARGIVQLREVLGVVDPGAESPQETRTRLALLAAGLPRPQTQIEVIGPDGKVFARIDIGWAQWKVAVEYDGEQHWADEKQRAWDIERQFLLEALGWVVIRVSARQLRTDPWGVAARVRYTLRAAGAKV
ncbi:DUF559 domain-containing protein [Rhodococcoides fascians]|jgi:hypothetical protein|uniref:DUF559 domain-containing protein n=1 Tax=Nocardiaceae TaxID=85025 RepID=UPI00050D0332|nr:MULTISPECIES: DUF559 domain-containing protein [Rhodococcus]KJV00454.1 hypothetical protein VF34_04500 [Rhodococcus sp. PML026]WQH27185.1 DUF559 domain-containing protein [Rhodococcus fascians]